MHSVQVIRRAIVGIGIGRHDRLYSVNLCGGVAGEAQAQVYAGSD